MIYPCLTLNTWILKKGNNTLRPRITIAVISISSFLFISASNALTQEQQFSKYNDLDGRFTIDYPSDWYVNEEPSDDKENVVQFDSSEPDMAGSRDITKPSVLILISDAKSDETSLERPSNKRVSNMAQVTTIEESERTTLSGLPAYTVKTMGGILEDPSKQVWSLHDGKVYHILYWAHPYDYEIYLPVVQHMINSFHITK
jgi:hypothetical protein